MRSLSFFFIIASLTLWTGCSDKTPDATRSTPQPPSPQIPTPQSKFVITDIDQRTTTLTLKQNHLTLDKVIQPIVLIHLFASWSPPSCGMIPYLDTLQKSYPKRLFVVGIMVNSDKNPEQLRKFMKTHHASYFISNSPDNDALARRLADFLKLGENYPVPITLLFKNGEYTMHYVGATPIEMIETDIESISNTR